MEPGYRRCMRSDERVCLACGAGAQADARFCAQCGRPLEQGGPAVYGQAPPRFYGVAAPDALFVAACLFLVFATVGFVAGSWLLGVALLAPALALLVLFYGAALRDSSSRVARVAVTAVRRLRAWAGFGWEYLGAWTGAGRSVVRLKRESRALRRERERVRIALGDAAYLEDEAGVNALRSRLREIDDGLAAREEEQAAILERARRRVEDEHLAVQPTRRVPRGGANHTRRVG